MGSTQVATNASSSAEGQLPAAGVPRYNSAACVASREERAIRVECNAEHLSSRLVSVLRQQQLKRRRRATYCRFSELVDIPQLQCRIIACRGEYRIRRIHCHLTDSAAALDVTYIMGRRRWREGERIKRWNVKLQLCFLIASALYFPLRCRRPPPRTNSTLKHAGSKDECI